MRIPVYDAQGKRTQEILEFDEGIFGKEVRKALLKEAILMYEARQRQGTHSTKTRSDCSGTGRKLWRQKGTGRARVGPARPPHWRGGGTVFGPHPRSYAYSIPKKAKKAATNSAWLAKFLDKEVLVIDNIEVGDAPKTSRIYEVLKTLGVTEGRTLIGLLDYNKVLYQSVRNIPRTSLDKATTFNPYVLLHNHKVILLRNAFEELVKSRGGEIKSLERKELYK